LPVCNAFFANSSWLEVSARDAIARGDPAARRIRIWAFGLMVLTILLKIAIAVYSRKAARKSLEN